jgi:hypothetical protein
VRRGGKDDELGGDYGVWGLQDLCGGGLILLEYAWVFCDSGQEFGQGGLEMDLIGTDQCIQICGREVTVTV